MDRKLLNWIRAGVVALVVLTGIEAYDLMTPTRCFASTAVHASGVQGLGVLCQ